MGLLSVAVDPDFVRTGFVYLYRSQAGAGGCEIPTGRLNQVVRGAMAGSSVDAGSGRQRIQRGDCGAALRRYARSRLTPLVTSTFSDDPTKGEWSHATRLAHVPGSPVGREERIRGGAGVGLAYMLLGEAGADQHDISAKAPPKGKDWYY